MTKQIATHVCVSVKPVTILVHPHGSMPTQNLTHTAYGIAEEDTYETIQVLALARP